MTDQVLRGALAAGTLLALGNHRQDIAYRLHDDLRAIGREVVMAGGGDDALFTVGREAAQAWPEVEAGPDKLVLSLDGTFVPLVGDEWADLKTLVVGEADEPKIVDGPHLV